MMCPLKFHSDYVADCEEEQCAWWTIPQSSTKAGRCAIRELAEKTFRMKEVRLKSTDMKTGEENT